MFKKLTASLFLISVATALFSCASSENISEDDHGTKSGVNHVADLQVVDCLLPGQVRRLGSTTYMTARRPMKTTAADCSIRGGEYVAYDRADYKTALKIWLPNAETGNAEAQVNVGEIFERGLGGEPNYQAAIIWYRKAAESGSSRAQFNLGTLYEQGLGVEKNKIMALNWYRQAWGLKEDSLIYQSVANAQQEELRQQLLKEGKQKKRQIGLLNKQLQQMQSSAMNSERMDELNSEIGELKTWITRLEAERQDVKEQADEIPRFREPMSLIANVSSDITEAESRSKGVIKFGKYYALLIGNEHYLNMDDLRSPLKDARQIGAVLEGKYGFSVKILTDVDNLSIMQAVNELNDVVTENDNLLIFYAGHGSRVESSVYESGYWLPVNADQPPNDTNWVSSEFITRHLSRIKAKRVLVVADSCYSGLLSAAPGHLFFGDGNDNNAEYLRYKLAKRSRLLLSSGGDKPVLDNAGDGNSVFARAFLDILENNDEILSTPKIFAALRTQVNAMALDVGFEQTPEFKAIKGAGHEVGDFFFVPNASL